MNSNIFLNKNLVFSKTLLHSCIFQSFAYPPNDSAEVIMDVNLMQQIAINVRPTTGCFFFLCHEFLITNVADAAAEE
jgi:hypothetical protein